MRRMGLSCQRELYVCIVNNLGMSKLKFAYVPSSEPLIYNLCIEVRTDMNRHFANEITEPIGDVKRFRKRISTGKDDGDESSSDKNRF